MNVDAMPRWAAALHRWAERVMRPVPGGRIPLNVAIDAHKAATGPFVLALMVMYGNYSAPAWVYLALHGSYGMVWVLKDVTLPDRRWQRSVGVPAAMAALAFLSLYWIAPVILIAGPPGVGWTPAPAWGLALAVAVHTIGVALMVAADTEKHVMLRRGRERDAERPGLITSGLYRRIRHPNYLGEMLVYGSYAVIVDHWLPWVVLAVVWALYFFPNMLSIEASLSRYPEYPAWRARTGLILPRFGRGAGHHS